MTRSTVLLRTMNILPNETRASPIAVQFDLVGVRQRLARVSEDTVMIGLADIPSYIPFSTLL